MIESSDKTDKLNANSSDHILELTSSKSQSKNKIYVESFIIQIPRRNFVHNGYQAGYYVWIVNT
jgi:hypothetical protein